MLEKIMDILLQVIGLCFIPLLAILVFSGMSEIYQGLKDHFGFQNFKVSEMAFKHRAIDLNDNFGFRRFNTNFCKS
jgi:hypothetical protein|tara:strand:- start:13465 stop:13692 length:228 start_codon:yes stop_codon:yes gene_type:complete